jgi:signal transduction histidine kinase
VLLLPVTAYLARGNAVLERLRLRSMLRRSVAEPVYLRADPGDGFWRRALRPLRDPQSWLDMLWSLIGLITGTVAFSLVVVWWSGALGGVSYWFWQRYIPQSSEEKGLAYFLGFGRGRTPESWVNLVVGLALLLTLPLVVRLAAQIHGSLAAVLLGSRAELQQQVARVETGRSAARAAEATALRRLERDIHDGPQQRLVRLTMELGRARRAVDADPERAAELIEGALGQARETVAELRSLSRGVAPPLLVDRGLAAALGEMLSLSAVPVESRLDVPDGLPPHVETAVYFVVAEALTNIAKHSGATAASVAVTPVAADLEVRVSDDGVGGAHLAKGQGLAGLRQRLTAVDGTLEVASPAGGPTVLVARIPLATGGDR